METTTREIDVAASQDSEPTLQEELAGAVSEIVPRPAARQLVFVLLAFGIVATTALAIVAVLGGDFGEGLGKAFGSALVSIGYGFLAIVGTHRMHQRASSTLAKASVATAIAGLATAVLAIWVDDSVNVLKLAWVGFIIAFATAHASLFQARRRATDHPIVRGIVTVTQVFIAIAATMLCILVITVEDVGRGFAQALTIVILIDVMLNVLVPIVRRALRSTPSAPESGAAAARTEVAMS